MRGIASGKGDPPMKAAGLIAAAGLSSRMEDFKPLMELNGFPMIAMTVRSMRNAGIRNITVVTGFRGEEVRKVLDPLGVSIVENPRYRETDMLASVKLGLSSMDTGNGVFFLPGDVPLTEPETFRKLWNMREERAGKVSALIPMNGEKQIHPPYLSPEGCAGVLGYKGDFGLKGAMDAQDPLRVNVWDQGAGQDADVPGDFRAMAQYAKAHRGVSERICESLYGEVSLPEHIRAHCRAVGELAAHMAEKLVEAGAYLDIELCRSGGCLHDLLRLSPHHEAAAEAFLEEKGYLALARVVGAHKGFPEEPETLCREEVLVCLADKSILETSRVSFEERYRKALEKKPVKERILRDIRTCRRLAEEYEVMTGEKL